MFQSGRRRVALLDPNAELHSARRFRHLCSFEAGGALRPRPLLLPALQPLLLLLQVRRHVVKALLLQVIQANAGPQRRWGGERPVRTQVM